MPGVDRALQPAAELVLQPQEAGAHIRPLPADRVLTADGGLVRSALGAPPLAPAGRRGRWVHLPCAAGSPGVPARGSLGSGAAPRAARPPGQPAAAAPGAASRQASPLGARARSDSPPRGPSAALPARGQLPVRLASHGPPAAAASRGAPGQGAQGLSAAATSGAASRLVSPLGARARSDSPPQRPTATALARGQPPACLVSSGAPVACAAAPASAAAGARAWTALQPALSASVSLLGSGQPCMARWRPESTSACAAQFPGRHAARAASGGVPASALPRRSSSCGANPRGTPVPQPHWVRTSQPATVRCSRQPSMHYLASAIPTPRPLGSMTLQEQGPAPLGLQPAATAPATPAPASGPGLQAPRDPTAPQAQGDGGVQHRAGQTGPLGEGAPVIGSAQVLGGGLQGLAAQVAHAPAQCAEALQGTRPARPDPPHAAGDPRAKDPAAAGGAEALLLSYAQLPRAEPGEGPAQEAPAEADSSFLLKPSEGLAGSAGAATGPASGPEADLPATPLPPAQGAEEDLAAVFASYEASAVAQPGLAPGGSAATAERAALPEATSGGGGSAGRVADYLALGDPAAWTGEARPGPSGVTEADLLGLASAGDDGSAGSGVGEGGDCLRAASACPEKESADRETSPPRQDPATADACGTLVFEEHGGLGTRVARGLSASSSTWKPASPAVSARLGPACDRSSSPVLPTMRFSGAFTHMPSPPAAVFLASGGSPKASTFACPAAQGSPELSSPAYPTEHGSPQLSSFAYPAARGTPTVARPRSPRGAAFAYPAAKGSPELSSFTYPSTHWSPKATTFACPAPHGSPELSSFAYPTVHGSPQLSSFAYPAAHGSSAAAHPRSPRGTAFAHPAAQSPTQTVALPSALPALASASPAPALGSWSPTFRRRPFAALLPTSPPPVYAAAFAALAARPAHAAPVPPPAGVVAASPPRRSVGVPGRTEFPHASGAQTFGPAGAAHAQAVEGLAIGSPRSAALKRSPFSGLLGGRSEGV
ncbi:unnamed protein product [Prorocentrum cordatum]|uniref:Uncharacterized protein n=1 Tax=Prorocentrum cordatum TaxID=2364126 RepID=A0ABN9XMA1_9DINO|nr:unnamed protein product [Polarella glacialis]